MFRFSPALPGFSRVGDFLVLKLINHSSKMTTEVVIDKRIPDNDKNYQDARSFAYQSDALELGQRTHVELGHDGAFDSAFCKGTGIAGAVLQISPPCSIRKKWRNYKSCGAPIRGERIIAFKTPLSQQYDNESDCDNGIKPHERFTPMDLLNHLRQNNIKLGMVVDFTNTNRYYDGRELLNHGILYRKIKCVGKEIPDDSVVSRFKIEALTFLDKNSNSDDVIGVHCTHGLNRAGYVVCRYLIECRGYTPERAIEAFNQARGHNMERENYLEDLQKKTPKTEDLSCLQIGNRRREQHVPLDKPRYLHTSTEFFTRHAAYDQQRMNWRSAQDNRYQSGYHDLKPHYRSVDRYLPVDNYTQSRNYVSRRFSNSDQRDSNYRNSNSNYDNYHNYGDLNYSRNNYRNHENSYRNYNNYASYGYDDSQRVRSREVSYRDNHVIRSKPSSASNRPRPYPYQQDKRY